MITDALSTITSKEIVDCAKRKRRRYATRPRTAVVMQTNDPLFQEWVRCKRDKDGHAIVTKRYITVMTTIRPVYLVEMGT